MSDQKPYVQTFFIIPAHIMRLKGITMAYLLVYETIFQFWHNGKNCYLSNSIILERTGISSVSTVKEAFAFFEKNNELKRIQKGNRRYLVQPERPIEEIDDDTKPSEDPMPVDNIPNNSTKNSQVADAAAGGSRRSGWGVADTAAYNKKLNLNLKNINKSSYLKSEKSVNNFSDKKLSIQKYGHIERSTMSDEFKNAERGDCKSDVYQKFIRSVPWLAKKYSEAAN